MPIHQTLTDNEGHTFRIVPSWWLITVSIITGANFIILMILAAILIDVIHAVEKLINK